tara:strand:- start:16380 stop:17720 length:1341 start_codon:yes stop_codon:yes gene_type:complete
MVSPIALKILVASGWLVTVAVAFTAGQWISDSPERGDAGIETRQGKGSSWRAAADPSATSESNEDATGLIEGEEGPGDDGRLPDSPLARILRGPGTQEDWREAGLAVALLSPEEVRYWTEAYLQMAPGPDRDRVLRMLLGEMAETDPAGAMKFAQSISSISESESTRRDILQAWGRNDPQSALAWIESNRGSIPSRLYSRRLESWVSGYAELDPAGAFAYVSAIETTNRGDRWMKERMIEEIVETQVRANQLDEALAELQKLPEGRLRSEALEEFYSEWARQDPQGAAEHFLNNREEDSERVAAGLIRQWASADPVQAAEFVSSMDASDPAYQVAISSLIERWSNYDLEGPAQWLNELPPSPEIDRAVAVYSVRASAEDPEGAMSWAASIESEDTRGRVMQRVAAEWKESDPEGLEGYIVENDLDEGTATELRNARSGGRRWRGPN